MSLASRAQRVAAAAAVGGGGLGAIGAAGVGLLAVEARMARRWIGTPFGKQGPHSSGRYGAGAEPAIEIAMLGDSSAVGLGVEDPRETPGAVIAAGLAAITGRPVELHTVAVVGAESRHLGAQVDRLTELGAHPDVAVIMVGANDVTHRIKPETAVGALGEVVRRLRDRGAEVVVGTCPDLGTIEPIAQPLRYLARRWSRELAAAQTIGVVEAGGRSVSLADLLGHEFVTRRREMFSADRFHPSAAGYARAAAALLPSVCAVLSVWPEGLAGSGPDTRRGERTDDVAHAAARAASTAGIEVSGTDVDGASQGPRGRWALLLRRPSFPALPGLPTRPGLPNLPTVPGLRLIGNRRHPTRAPKAGAAQTGAPLAGATRTGASQAPALPAKAALGPPNGANGARNDEPWVLDRVISIGGGAPGTASDNGHR
jgi:lysophospholipase L1-like esterase